MCNRIATCGYCGDKVICPLGRAVPYLCEDCASRIHRVGRRRYDDRRPRFRGAVNLKPLAAALDARP